MKARRSLQFVVVEERGPARWIFLNRPEVKNAFHLEMARELREALRRALTDPGLSLVVLSGRGECFSAGGDIRAMSETMSPKKFFLDISREIHAAVLEIRRSERLVLGAAPGFTGGVALGLFLSADLRLGSQSSSYSAATIRLGLVANGSTTYFLPRIAGLARAAEILFLGDTLSASQALDAGILHRVVPSIKLEEEVQAFAERLATSPRQALGRLKKVLNASLTSTLPAQLERERQAIAWSSTTPDFREGVRAFLEKRPPRFG